MYLSLQCVVCRCIRNQDFVRYILSTFIAVYLAILLCFVVVVVALQKNESLLNNVCEERMTDYHVRYLPGILFTLIFILLCVALLCKLCFSLQNQSKFAAFLGYSFTLYLYFQCYCCCVVLLASKNILVRSTRLYENVPACVTNYACYCCCCCCCSYCCILLCFL